VNILIVNVGSTSLKYTLYHAGRPTARGRVQRIGMAGTQLSHIAGSGVVVDMTADHLSYEMAIRRMLALLAEGGDLVDLSSLDAVGFKVVHGGSVTGTVRLTPQVLAEMERFRFTAPGHNPPYIAAIRLFAREAPTVPLVGVFETGFHRTLPPEAYTYGVPYAWLEDYGIRRYGFHGASHGYIGGRAAELLGPGKRVVSCHLGGSSSVCALVDGRSVDVSMGFSPQGGPPQSNRVGDLDAFVVLHLLKMGLKTVDGLIDELTSSGGLKGISGVSGDVRDLEEAAAAGDERARLALDIFAYDVRKLIGAYAAAMGGLDAVVFTGGTGENGADMRSRILSGLEFLGVGLDAGLNAAVVGREGRISAPGAPIQVWVLPTDEEQVVAGEVAAYMVAYVAADAAAAVDQGATNPGGDA